MRSKGYSSWFVCTYVCVSVLICRLTHWNHKREISKDSSQYKNQLIVSCVAASCYQIGFVHNKLNFGYAYKEVIGYAYKEVIG